MFFKYTYSEKNLCLHCTYTPNRLAVQGLVLPFNILVSKLAKDMEDRAMMVNLNYLSFGR